MVGDSDDLYFAIGPAWHGPGSFHVRDLEYQTLGQVTVGDDYTLDDSYGAAYRHPYRQVVTCNDRYNRTTGGFPPLPPRLFVFDVADPTAPQTLNVVDIPGAVAGPCWDLGFDDDGYLWWLHNGYVTRIILDPMGNILSNDWFYLSGYPGGGPTSLALEPRNRRLYVGYYNANWVGVFSLDSPTALLARVTDLCEEPTHSPRGIEFSESGDLYGGCSNIAGATNDVFAISAEALQGLSGTVTADQLGAQRFEIPPLVDFNVEVKWLVHTTRCTPEPEIQCCIDLVNQYVAAGVLNRGQGNGLIVKSEAAMASLDRDNPTAALNELYAFLNQVDAFVTAGTLTPEKGQELSDCANAVIDWILQGG